MTVYGRQEQWEDSPEGWPQPFATDGAQFREFAMRLAKGDCPAVRRRSGLDSPPVAPTTSGAPPRDRQQPPRPLSRLEVGRWTETAQDWLDQVCRCVDAYDPDDVSGLFSEDVAYRYHPYDEPIVGRDAVVASWLGECVG